MCTEILAGQVTTTAWDYRHVPSYDILTLV